MADIETGRRGDTYRSIEAHSCQSVLTFPCGVARCVIPRYARRGEVQTFERRGGLRSASRSVAVGQTSVFVDIGA